MYKPDFQGLYFTEGVSLPPFHHNETRYSHEYIQNIKKEKTNRH